MRNLLASVLMLLPTAVFSQSSVPPDREALLAGDGMGMARAAEENGYPGPKHVLELQVELGLLPDQLRKVEALREGVTASARVLGQQIVEKESLLVDFYRSNRINDQEVQALLREIGTLRADLRFVHLQAHRRMREILTPAQIRTYYQHRSHETRQTH